MILPQSDRCLKTLGCALAFIGTVAGSAFAQTFDTVRFSYGLGREALPALAAIELGFFFREGLNVSALPVASLSTTIESLKTGTADVATVPARGLILIAQRRLPVRIVALSGEGLSAEILVAASAKKVPSLTDLKGKVIGIDLESEVYPHFLRYLAISRMQHSWFRILHVDHAEMEETFKRRRIEAAVVPRHISQELVEGKMVRRLVSHEDFASVTQGVNPSALVVRKALMDARPQVVERFVRAWTQGLLFSTKNAAHASHLLKQFYERQGVSVPAEVVRAYVNLARYDRCAWNERDSLDVEYSALVLKHAGVITEAPSIRGLVENRFVRKVSPQC
jgi:ABC-type nitrate/sulfonate/bicarbonate transport system substrate-binding protein